MGGCCNDCASDVDAQSAKSQLVDGKLGAKNETTIEESGCCSGGSCECGESCVDRLAQIICENDDNHLHKQGSDNTVAPGAVEGVLATRGDNNAQSASGSDCSCCEKEKSFQDDASIKKAEDLSIPSALAKSCGQSGLRKRTSAKSTQSVCASRKEACGEHRSMARSRYDTLAAFGCVCKALLARGLSSCCAAPAKGKATARSMTSKQSTRSARRGRASCQSSRESLVDSCCGKSDCGKKPLSVRSLSYRGHSDIQVVKSAATGSRESVDSCQDSCCKGEDEDGKSCVDEKASVREEKHVALDMSAGPVSSSEHVVLAIKGMTCTGCENKLMRTMQGITTISNAKASLVLCRAEFDFNPAIADLSAIIELIEHRSGFTAEIVKSGVTRELPLTVPRVLQEKFLTAPRPDGVENVARSDKDTVVVTYDPRVIGARKVLQEYEPFSPTLATEPPDPSITAGMKHIRSLVIRTASSAMLTIPVLVMTWAPLPPHHHAYSIASLVLATIIQTVITGPIYVSCFKSVVFSRLIEVEMLIVLSTTTAYVYSVVAFAFDMLGRPLSTGQFFETSTLLVTLILLGQCVSAIARQRAIEAISIRSLQERNARIVLPDGAEEVIDARLLHYDDRFKVLPDSAIITDGVVVSGTSTVDESMMTGESRPIEKTVGDAVIAGTLNGPSTLVVKVARLPGENTISDIAGMVDHARFSRARVQETVDWVCGWFVPVVLALATTTFVVWIGVGMGVRKQSGGHAVITALTYAISVLAISCPCAIGLAVPMVILMAGGVGAKLGLVFKAATTIEQARKVNHVVLDKTGTVTQGKLSVVSRFLEDDAPEYKVVDVVAALVASSRHPVARAVAADLEALQANAAGAPVENAEMVIGKGMQAILLGQPLRGGSATWLGLESNPAVQPLLAQSLTTFCVVHGSRLIAAFGLSDTLRPEARSVVQALTARNIRVSILSGDHAAAVYSTASELGIPASRVRAGCLPADKQAYIKELTAHGDTVLFCGDGTNDAVALAQAAIGVHLHTGEGSGVAASTAADVVLTHPTLTGLLALMELSDAVARRIALNFSWAFVYNLVAILFAAGAFVDTRIPPAYAGLGELVSVLPVVLVAIQLKWFKASAHAA